MTNATRHLELLNVKHFIARWSGTREALAQLPNQWRLLREAQGWALYELLTHDGSYVYIPQFEPIALRCANRKVAALEWLYAIESLNQPFALLADGEAAGADIKHTCTVEEFVDHLAACRDKHTKSPLRQSPIPDTHGAVTAAEVTDNCIRFRTSALGLPHIVKCSYYPNWKVRGADRVYWVTPGFMLVYPRQPQVELYYGWTFSDNVGRALTVVGALAFLAALWWRRPGRRT
jgi:hypothetical protein